MNDTLMVIGEALIDFIPTEQGMALKDVCSFTKHCGGAPINIAAATAKLLLSGKVFLFDDLNRHILASPQFEGSSSLV